MGLTPGTRWLGLGLLAWCVVARGLPGPTVGLALQVAAVACWGRSLAVDLADLPQTAPHRRGRLMHCGAGLLVVAAVALHAAAARLSGGVPGLVATLVWLLPLCSGAVARVASDRALRSGPLDGARIEARARAGFWLGLGLWGAVGLNLAVIRHDLRRDFSYRAASEPSAQVRALVAGLREPLAVVVLLEGGSELAPVLQPYLQALSRASQRVSVRVSDAALVPALTRAHGVRGNGFVLLLAGQGQSQRGESFYLGTSLHDARSVLKSLDAHVANHLSALIQPRRVVYLTAGHGERSVAGDVDGARGRFMREFEVLLARFNVRTRRLGIADGLASAVPGDAAAVLVMGPERPFLAEEAGALRRYVEGGGRLWLGLEPGADAGLGAVTRLVGVAPVGAQVLCKESFAVRTRTAADMALIRTHRYARHAITRALRGEGGRAQLVFVRATALALSQPERPCERSVAVQSEGDCLLDPAGRFSANLDAPTQPWPLVVASRFAAPRGGEARVVVSGDGDLGTDQVLRNAANTLVCLDVLRWLLGDEALRPQVLASDDLPVLHQRQEDRAWFYWTAFFVPTLFFAFAAFRARPCRSRPYVGRDVGAGGSQAPR